MSLSELFVKIKVIYNDAKVFAEKYECDEVLLNDGKLQRDIMNEYAKQVNKSNKCRKNEVNLENILVLLQDARTGLSNTQAGQKSIKQVETYIDSVKMLLKVYQTIGQMQSSIIKYYEKGGATF